DLNRELVEFLDQRLLAWEDECGRRLAWRRIRAPAFVRLHARLHLSARRFLRSRTGIFKISPCGKPKNARHAPVVLPRLVFTRKRHDLSTLLSRSKSAKGI